MAVSTQVIRVVSSGADCFLEFCPMLFLFRCSNKNWKGRIVLSNNSLVSSEPHVPQCSPMTARDQERQIMRQSVKRKATEDLSSRPLKIARQVHLENDYKELCAKDLDLVRRSINWKRNKAWPNIPQSKEHLEAFLDKGIQEEFIKTLKGELFLYRSENGVYMFTCESNLRYVTGFISTIVTIRHGGASIALNG